MAYDKVVDSAQLDADLTSIANGIRSILGSTESMGLDGMPTQLNSAVSEIGNQADLIAQISTILDDKAAGGGSGGTLWGCKFVTGSLIPSETLTSDYTIALSDILSELTEEGESLTYIYEELGFFIARKPIDSFSAYDHTKTCAVAYNIPTSNKSGTSALAYYDTYGSIKFNSSGSTAVQINISGITVHFTSNASGEAGCEYRWVVWRAKK